MSKGVILPEEIKTRAMKLYMAGLSPAKIAIQLTHEFNTVCRPSTVSHWADKENWSIKRLDATEKALLRVSQKREVSIAEDVQNKIEAYRLIQQKALESLQGEDSLEFKKAMDAAQAVDLGIKGEQKLLAGVLGMQFIQDVLQILLDEIKDDQLLNRIALRLKAVAVDLANK